MKILFFLGLCCLAYAQDLRDSTCTTSAEQLFKDGCDRGCIALTRTCPVCLDTVGCTALTDECRPAVAGSCNDNQICVASGVAGLYTCINRLGVGQECREDSNYIDDFIERLESGSLELDFASRDVVNKLSDIAVPCLPGLVCRRDRLDRRVCVEESGPCPLARAGGALVQCDEDGNFAPLQCRKRDGSLTYQCQCVMPSTGVPVPDTLVEVSDLREDRPDCEDMVLQRCQYRSGRGDVFSVRSGETFINPSTCSRCLCRNGDEVLCQRLPAGSCDEFNPTPGPDRPRDCTIRGRTLSDGDSLTVDCNRCGCRNGELVCTQRDCEDDEEEGDDEEDPMEIRNCRACGAMRASPVCGDDGRTYPSRCFATVCRGLDADDLSPGPCTRRDVCMENLCEDGEVCLRTGGVTCLSRDGCRPERLRRCVDLEALRCRRREDDNDEDESPTNGEEPSDGEEPTSDNDEDSVSDGSEDDAADAVCGSNGRTFSSVCSLIQNSAQVDIAYAGSCNRTACSGGEVCGTDGETYDNICELQTTSANARVDYRGECEEDETDEVIDNKCIRLRRSNRCARLTDCRNRVRPGDGCCPICGGAVTIGLDKDAVDQYVRLNPAVDTVDEFLKVLIASRFFPEDVLRSCKVALNFLKTGDLHMVLESPDGMVCAMAAQKIADRINNPPTETTTTTTAVNHQILQLATVAQTSPLVDEDGNIPMAAGAAVPVASFSLAVMLIPILTLFV